MTDLATNLRRVRADMLGTNDEEHYWHCHEAADEIERLQEQIDLKNQSLQMYEEDIRRLRDERLEMALQIKGLRSALAKSCEEGRDEMYDCGYNRLRAALERIIAREDSTQNQAYFDLIEIAREALRDE